MPSPSPRTPRDRLRLQALLLRTQGWGYGRIGVRLGVPKSTVRYWLDKAHADRVRAANRAYKQAHR